MAEQLQTVSVSAPGFFGLNTQESPTSVNPSFATQALNCVIDKFGRIGARKGWSKVNAVNADLGSNPVGFIFEVVKEGGNDLISAGNNKLFTGTTTLTQKLVRNSANTANESYSISANNWQGAAIPYDSGLTASTHAYIVQAGHKPLVYHKLPLVGTGATLTVSTVSGGVITAVTVSAGGSNWYVNDEFTVTGGTGSGAKFRVNTVSGTAIATVAIVSGGTGYTASDSLTAVDTTDRHTHEGDYGFQLLSDVGSVPAGHTASTFMPNIVMAAWGRTWYADITNDKQTVYFSDLLDGGKLTGGSAGSINIASVVPNSDPIVALAAHNNFLIIFCKKNTVIYSNADDPTALTLSDVITGIGCVGRDTIQHTGSDVIFLSDTGVRSLLRVIQEKSLPFRELSKNIRDQLITDLNSETAANIKSAYSPNDAFYLLSFPTTKVVYCFDMRAPLQDGAARVTTWNSIEPVCFCVAQDKTLYLGKTGYVGKYNTYLDDTATYRFEYYSSYFDFQTPTQLKILKDIKVVIFGGSEAGFTIKWGFDYNGLTGIYSTQLPKGVFAEYGIAEYNTETAVYSSGETIARMLAHAGSTGRVVQVGFEAEINNKSFSIQAMDVFVKQGRTI